MRRVQFMLGSGGALTLAKRRYVQFPNGGVQTPILLPSFSSKGFPELQKVFDVTKEYISDEILVSAYDIRRNHLREDFDFSSVVFLDSGGYEASKDLDMSDTYEVSHKVKDWSIDDYQSVLDEWKTNSPTVFVSFDGPKAKMPYLDQIDAARQLRIPGGPHVRALLFKPETERSVRHDMKGLLAACRHADEFPIIGVTEKEIGNSILSRMTNVARLRRALDRLYDHRPIHVFGSLDTISTYLYFLAGADIFDGLSWLRYAFVNGETVYRHSYGIMNLPFSTVSEIAEAGCWQNNYQYTRQMLITMSKYLLDGDFVHFGRFGPRIKDAFDSMNAVLAGDDDGR